MIITRLTGGLGNQMFQYAAGRALALKHGAELKLDRAWFTADPAPLAHEAYALDGFSLTPAFATPQEIDAAHNRGLPRLVRWSRGLRRRLGLPVPGVAYDGDFSFQPGFWSHPDGTYLHGNWQSEKYFAPAGAAIRQDFAHRTPPPPDLQPILDRIGRGPSVCVHFRRGDYVSNPTYARENGALDLAYYERAITRVRARSPDAKLYVFSDDIERVAAEFNPGCPHEYVREPAGTTPAETLRLMRACRHFVIANSTLSWWAAWLSTAADQVVIAPDPWFAGRLRNGADIVPDHWQRLPRTA